MKKLFFIVLVFLINSVQADVIYMRAHEVYELMNHERLYGGCMARTVPSPSSRTTQCAGTWVTLDCLGLTRDAKIGLEMKKDMTLAMITGKQVKIWMDTNVKLNGYCIAERIDIVN